MDRFKLFSRAQRAICDAAVVLWEPLSNPFQFTRKGKIFLIISTNSYYIGPNSNQYITIPQYSSRFGAIQQGFWPSFYNSWLRIRIRTGSVFVGLPDPGVIMNLISQNKGNKNILKNDLFYILWFFSQNKNQVQVLKIKEDLKFFVCKYGVLNLKIRI